MSILHKNKFQYIYISVLTLISFVLLAASFPRELSYGGRLTDEVGKPWPGPVDLQISFYDAETNGTVLGASPYIFDDVKLAAGMFAVTFNFSATDLHDIFQDSSRMVWVEIKDLTHDRLYPRQRFNVVPYALKVPVDGVSINYNTQGELQVLKVEQNQVIGLSTALAGKAEPVDFAAKADAAHTHGALSGDASGNFNAAIVSKIQGVPVIDPVSGTDNGKYLSYDGSSWKLQTVTPPPPTTDASLLTSGTLPDARLSSNVSLLGSSIDTAEISDGAVTAAKLDSMGCTNHQILKFDGTNWVCAADNNTATTDASALTSGILADARLSSNVSLLGHAIDTSEIADGAVTAAKLNAMGCVNNQILKFNGTSWTCSADNDSATADAAFFTSGTLADSRLSSNVSLLGSTIETAEITSGAVTVAKLNDMGCVSNQILKYNGSTWVCAADNNTQTTDAAMLTSGELADARLSSNVSLLGSSIETAEIADGAVTSAKIAAGTIGTTQLANGSVSSAKLANGSVGTIQLADGAVTNAKLSSMGCTSQQILKFDGANWVCASDSTGTGTTDASALTSGMLADGRLSSNVSLLGSAIDTAEMTDGSVTSAKIATGAVGLSQLADSSVSSAKLASGAIGTTQLADNGVTTAKIADGTIDLTKLNAMGCTSNQILKYNGSVWVCAADAGGSATNNASALTSGVMADARLSSNVSLMGAAIDTAEISENAVTTTKLADGAITAAKLSAMGCANDQILKFNGASWVCDSDASGSSTSDASAFTSGMLADARLSANISLLGSTIDTADISTSAVNPAAIADGAITAAKLNGMGCIGGQILKYNGSAWACAADDAGVLTADASTLTSGVLADARLSSNISLLGSSIDTVEITDAAVTSVKIADGAITAAKLSAMGCASGQILKFDGTSWICVSDNTLSTTDASALTSGTLADTRLSANVSLLGSSIDTADIAANAVTATKIAGGAVDTAQLANSSVSSAKLASGAIGTTQLANSSVTTAKIADGTITAAKLNAMGCSNTQILKYNGSAWICDSDNAGVPTTDADTLTSGTLADARLSASVSLLGSSIETNEITDSAVTNAKIADGAITAAKLNAMGCTSGQILRFNGTSWTCAADSSNAATTDASTLTSGILADTRLSANVSLLGSSIDTAEIAAGAVTSAKIAAGAVGLTELADGSVSSAKIAAGAIGATQIASDGVTSIKIADDAITAAKLAGCANTQTLKFNGTSWACAADDWGIPTSDASALTSGTLPDARLSANVSLLGSSIDTAEIATGAVTTAKIAAGAVDTVALADGGVSSAKISSGAINTTQLASSGVTSAKIADGAITAAKLNAMGCANGQILKHNGTTWICAADSSNAVTSDASALTSGTLADTRLSSNVSLLGTSIDTAEISDGAVTTAKIADGAITAAKLNAMGCTNTKILKYNGSAWACADDNDVATTDASLLTSGVLPDARLPSNVSLLGSAIDTAEITNDAITTVKIADDSITSAKIADATIVDADINASAAIADTKLATISTAGKVSAGAITSGTIGGSTSISTSGSISSSGNISVMGTGSAVTELHLNDDDNSNYVALKSAAVVSSDVTWTLPATDGTSGYVLSTDGSGTLSWVYPKPTRTCTGGVANGSYGGHCYARFGNNQILNWHQANAHCLSWGGYLVVITSSGEQSYIDSNIRGGYEAWVGGYDMGKEGQWEWITRETWSYTNWDTSEPNNGGGNEDCLLLSSNGKWNDFGCIYARAFICESE